MGALKGGCRRAVSGLRTCVDRCPPSPWDCRQFIAMPMIGGTDRLSGGSAPSSLGDPGELRHHLAEINVLISARCWSGLHHSAAERLRPEQELVPRHAPQAKPRLKAPRAIRKRFGGFVALDAVTCMSARASASTYTRTNGSGKTNHDQVHFRRPVRAMRAGRVQGRQHHQAGRQAAAAGHRAHLQIPHPFRTMTVLENLMRPAGGSPRACRGWDAGAEAGDPDLVGFRTAPAIRPRKSDPGRHAQARARPRARGASLAADFRQAMAGCPRQIDEILDIAARSQPLRRRGHHDRAHDARGDAVLASASWCSRPAARSRRAPDEIVESAGCEIGGISHRRPRTGHPGTVACCMAYRSLDDGETAVLLGSKATARAR